MKYTEFKSKPSKKLSERRGGFKKESFGIVQLEQTGYFLFKGVEFRIRPQVRADYAHGKNSTHNFPELCPVPSKSGNRHDFQFWAFNKRWSFNRVAGFLFGQDKMDPKLSWEDFQEQITVKKGKIYVWEVDHLPPTGAKLFSCNNLEVVTRKVNLERQVERQRKEEEAKKRAEHLRKTPKQKTRSSTRRL
jgi:hypothetical protein